MKTYTLGVDYGTNSVRAILVDCANGQEVATTVYSYLSGKQGILLDPNDHNLARQHPRDYLNGLESTIQGVLKQAFDKGIVKEQVIGIGVDTTGSTPLPVDHNNIPLALAPHWENELAAMAWLWKDHTSAQESAKITELALEHRPQYLAKCGGIYSSEWFWSKIWKCLKTTPNVFEAAYSWVELADYIPSVLVGCQDPTKIVRGVCAAGHKAMYADAWGGLPDKAFLKLLSPELANLRDRLYNKAYDANTSAGKLCLDWAQRLGLNPGIEVAVGAFDAHYGAIGSGITEGALVKIMGTSTCDCMVTPLSKNIPDIPGICGIVEGSILPGHLGLEAGQSAVGDIFKWFVEQVCHGKASLHQSLTESARMLKPGQSGLLALDWNNGNRTILVDPRLSGLLLGQTLHTTQSEIYRALVEATAFGARMIIERVKHYGVSIKTIICCGGVAEKNSMLMQIYADVTGCPIQISSSSQTCALGAAVVASALAGPTKGGHTSITEAQEQMTSTKEVEFHPIPKNVAIYNQLFEIYQQLHDSFGGMTQTTDLSNVMKTLIALKEGKGDSC